jgi:DNA-binding NarL/FixJ family response regulator
MKESLMTAMNGFRYSPDRPERRVRVLLVDDAPQVRRDLRLLLELAGGIEIAGEASGGEQAVRLAHLLEPDVVVMDLDMPGMDGFEATRQIKAQQTARQVVILSVHAGPEERERARACGADRFVIKGASYDELVNAIRKSNGSPYLSDLEKGTDV